MKSSHDEFLERAALWVLLLSWLAIAAVIVVLLFQEDGNASEMGTTLEGGAKVRLMNRPCHFDVNRMGGYLVMPHDGTKVHGCWVFYNDAVHFRLNHGETMTIPWNKFAPVIDGTEFVPPQPVQKPNPSHYI
jgi:hypothetical protein